MKLLAIQYSSQKHHIYECCKASFKDFCKEIFDKKNYDYILVEYANRLFILEATTNGEYTRTEIEYHPLRHLLNT